MSWGGWSDVSNNHASAGEFTQPVICMGLSQTSNSHISHFLHCHFEAVFQFFYQHDSLLDILQTHPCSHILQLLVCKISNICSNTSCCSCLVIKGANLKIGRSARSRHEYCETEWASVNCPVHLQGTPSPSTSALWCSVTFPIPVFDSQKKNPNSQLKCWSTDSTHTTSTTSPSAWIWSS